MVKHFLLVISLLWLCFNSQPVFAQTVPQATISWRANTESDLAGYRIYQSTTSGNYATGPMYVIQPNVTRITVPLPTTRCSTRYYWVVTAVDLVGHESPRSFEVSKTIAGTHYWTGVCKK